jgi:hypothetical protein
LQQRILFQREDGVADNIPCGREVINKHFDVPDECHVSIKNFNVLCFDGGIRSVIKAEQVVIKGDIPRFCAIPWTNFVNRLIMFTKFKLTEPENK